MKLQRALSELQLSVRCSIVFCLTQNESCWELNPNRFFPASLLTSLGVKHVKFNPVMKTEIVRAVKRCAALLGIPLNPAAINRIKEKADGRERV